MWWSIFRARMSPALTRADEDASGRSRAYLVAYNADEVINWSYDAAGRTGVGGDPDVLLKQDSVKSFGWKRETRWIYYDREKFEIYERRGAIRRRSSWWIRGGTGLPGSGACRFSSCGSATGSG